jgi:hypothetical protein
MGIFKDRLEVGSVIVDRIEVVVSHTWPEMLFESLAKLGCMSWL